MLGEMTWLVAEVNRRQNDKPICRPTVLCIFPLLSKHGPISTIDCRIPALTAGHHASDPRAKAHMTLCDTR